MITHEEARKSIGNIDYLSCHLMADYIAQQENQEKLLELYKEINNKRKELITLSRHNTWSWKLDIEIKEIQDKIKELEKLSKVGKEE